MKKRAWINKAIPRKMTKTRNAVAGGIKKMRSKTESLPDDTKGKKVMKLMGRRTVNSAALHPDVGALYLTTAPIPGFPTTTVTAGYSMARKPIVNSMKKIFKGKRTVGAPVPA